MNSLNYLILKNLIFFILLKSSLNTNSTNNPVILDFYTKASNNDNFTIANYKSYLYSRVVFGSDEQRVEMRLQLDKHSTYITKNSIVDPLYNVYTYDDTTSTTYKYITYISTFYFDDFYAATVSNETLYTNNGILKNFTFAYTIDIKYYLEAPAGSIGFHIAKQYSSEYNLNFIDQLKKNNLISGYGLTINFTTRNEGNLIIGPDFDEIDENYKKYKKTIILVNEAKTPYDLKWEFNLKSVSFGEKILNDTKNASLNIDTDFIIATDEYSTIIYDIFFVNLIIQQKKCVIENIISQSYYKVIKCDKDTKINEFPELIFNAVNYDGESFSFSFNYKDLFELKDDYYYFKIILVLRNESINDINISWKFGRTFFRKFIVTLNKDKKTITFYKKIDDDKGGDESKNDGKKSQEENKFNIIYIVLITILILVCIILVIVIFKYCGLSKKLKNKERKNVLLDEDDAYIDITKNEKLTTTINEN